MYHPDAMLKIGHDREAELVREAQACGMSKAQADRPRIASRRLVLTLAAAAPIVLWAIWLFVS